MFENLRLDSGTAVEILDGQKKKIAAGILESFRELDTAEDSAMAYRLDAKEYQIKYPHWIRLADGTEFKVADHGFIVGSNIQK